MYKIVKLYRGDGSIRYVIKKRFLWYFWRYPTYSNIVLYLCYKDAVMQVNSWLSKNILKSETIKTFK